jgi:3-hydroxy-9,10-secoandrosta-1,3,5(10)-triene-9,17-dione monooxygenase reductase component
LHKYIAVVYSDQKIIINNGRRETILLRGAMSQLDVEWIDVAASIDQEEVAEARTPDHRHLRNALGCFPTGVTIITTSDEDGTLYGVTASSFNSVSLDPPMVLWSQTQSAPSHPVFRRAAYFGVNVLGHDQQALSDQFSRPAKDKFAQVEYDLTEEGVPLLRGVAAQFVCRNDYRCFGGDHTVFFGTVLRFGYSPVVTPLIFSRGKYIS